MNFDAPGNRTVDSKGSINTVNIITTGYEKKKTILLLCWHAWSMGQRFDPWSYLRETLCQRRRLPPNVYVSVNEKGWMNEHEMWIQCGAGKVDSRVLGQKVWAIFCSHVIADYGLYESRSEGHSEKKLKCHLLLFHGG